MLYSITHKSEPFLTGNKIGLSGMDSLLRAMEYQTKLLADNKSNGTGLMRLIVGVSF